MSNSCPLREGNGKIILVHEEIENSGGVQGGFINSFRLDLKIRGEN